MKGIIAGTGIDRLLPSLEKASVSTKYGSVEYFKSGSTVIIPRHGSEHSLAPSRVNYLANIKAFEDLGVDEVVGIYAVGSVTSRLSPGSYGLVEDFLDFTGRSLSFCDGVEGPLEHTGMVGCFDRSLMTSFAKAFYRSGEREIRSGIVYATTNGPRLETPAEIRALRNLGADVVGMTLSSEVTLLREKKIACCAVAYSINWAAGLDEEGVSFLEDETVERLSKKILTLALDCLSDRSAT